jgi:predicted transport protein
MPLYRLKNKVTVPIKEASFPLEKDLQVIVENNLETLFGLKFISGSLNSELGVRVNEQDFYIDTLAFNEQDKSFVIIEYKKDRSFSVIDQGYAYLSAMLHNKAEFILELNEKLKKNFKKSDIDWEASRIIFISPEFTNYQKNAINFKDLPMFLYEVKIYDNGLIFFNYIKPYRTAESIKTITQDKIVKEVSKEIKVYDMDDLISINWGDTRDLYEEFEKQLLKEIQETKVKFTKKYIAFQGRRGQEWVNYVEIVPQQQGLKVYFRFPYNHIKSRIKIEDCSKKGHWTNGISYFYLSDPSIIPEAVRLSSESYKYLLQEMK